MRRKLRPDIMLVELSPEEHAQWVSGDLESDGLSPTHKRRRRKIWILEEGYCSDTRYLGKLAEKESQHAPLCNALQSYGYNVSCLPIVLGNMGCVYNTNTTALKEVGLDANHCKKLLSQLHLHAVTCLQKIVQSRRFLERQTAPRSTQRFKRKRHDPP